MLAPAFDPPIDLILWSYSVDEVSSWPLRVGLSFLIDFTARAELPAACSLCLSMSSFPDPYACLSDCLLPRGLWQFNLGVLICDYSLISGL